MNRPLTLQEVAEHLSCSVRTVEREIVPHNPCREVDRMVIPARQRLLTASEYAAISKFASPRLRAIMAVCALTGQRIGDVLSLTRAQLGADGIAFQQQKTGSRLVVAWSPELREAVDAALALSGNVIHALVFHHHGKPLAHQNVWRAYKQAAARAGIADTTLHDLRAMAATEADRQGLDARGLMGHREARTTAIYLRDKTVPVVVPPKLNRR